MPSTRRPPSARRKKQHCGGTLSWLCAATVVGAGGVAWLVQTRRESNSAAVATATAAAQPLVGALPQTVYDRGLVTRQAGARSVLRENGAFYFNVTRRVSPGPVLGFVSPWSERGEEVAWRFASKLTHLSPILYGVNARGQLRAHERESWLDTLREGLACPSCPPPARLVPLVSLAGLDFGALFGADDAEEQAGRLIVALTQAATTRALDGFVLDAHAHLAPLPRELRQRCASGLHLFVQLLAHQVSLSCPAAFSRSPFDISPRAQT